MCLLGAGLGYFAYSNRRMRTRFVTKMGKIRELKFKSSQRCENTLKLNSRNNWFRFREFTAGHYSSATGTATLIDDDDESPIIRGFRCLSFISSFQKIWFLMSHLFQWWRALSHVRGDQLWLTVIKQRGQRKKGHSTHLYRLGWWTSDYLLWSGWTVDDALWGYPFLFPTWISTGFFFERVVLRLVTASLFSSWYCTLHGHGYLIKSDASW